MIANKNGFGNGFGILRCHSYEYKKVDSEISETTHHQTLLKEITENLSSSGAKYTPPTNLTRTTRPISGGAEHWRPGTEQFFA